MDNRSRRARESAGLSLVQAARLLGITRDQLRDIEISDAIFARADQTAIADFYGVNLDWLCGRVALRNHAALRRIPGADELLFCDRDALAELLASLPRGAR